MPDQRFDDTALKMLHRVGGQKLVTRMQGLFLVNGRARLQSMGDAVDTGDAESGARFAHSLKSSAGQLGAVHLQSLCDKIESACTTNDLATARELIGAAREELPAATLYISNWKAIDEKNSGN